MTRRTAALVLLMAACAPPVAAAPPERDLGAEVRAAFAGKCAACHGSGLPRPKGRFGYVLDLRRVAGNPEMVVPSRPDESELWALIERGEMPPSDSPRGPLTAAEKESIRAWIAAGVSDAGPPVPGAPEASTRNDTSSAAPAVTVERAVAERAIRWFGNWHLLLLHFPIALVLAAGIGEIVSAWHGSRVPSPAVRFCLTWAAVAVVPTVVFGWFHAAAGNGAAAPLLAAHRLLGTAAGVWLLGIVWCAERDARCGRRYWSTRAALATGVGAVLVTAHFGGLLVHGADFFAW